MKSRSKTPSRAPNRALSCARIALVLLLPALIGWVQAHADLVHLKNGKRLEGRIVTQSGGQTVIELASGGRVTLPTTQIDQVVSAPTPAAVLAEREAKLTAGDTDGLYALATWCEEKRLREDSTRLLWRLLEIDPNHADAREDLGFRRLGALWLTEADYFRALGKVQDGKEWVTVEEWQRRENQRLKAEERGRADRLFRQAAGTGKAEERSAALAEFEGLSPALQAWSLRRGLVSLRSRDRQFAVRQLASRQSSRNRATLSHLAITDGRRSVRDEALGVLREWNHKDTALSFVPFLGSNDDRLRVNAARALNVFPDRRAAGPLITTASLVWAGFGRSHIVSVTQRAYVKDYELVSGGTGLVVQEVADPVVDTFQEGVVLDIAIRRVEAVARAAALARITGKSYGTNFAQWDGWWKKEAGSLGFR